MGHQIILLVRQLTAKLVLVRQMQLNALEKEFLRAAVGSAGLDNANASLVQGKQLATAFRTASDRFAAQFTGLLVGDGQVRGPSYFQMLHAVVNSADDEAWAFVEKSSPAARSSEIWASSPLNSTWTARAEFAELKEDLHQGSKAMLEEVTSLTRAIRHLDVRMKPCR